MTKICQRYHKDDEDEEEEEEEERKRRRKKKTKKRGREEEKEEEDDQSAIIAIRTRITTYMADKTHEITFPSLSCPIESQGVGKINEFILMRMEQIVIR